MEDTGRQCHVEDSVSLFPAVLNLLDVFVELLERFIFIILSADVCTYLAETLELFFHLFCGGLDV